MWDFLGNLSKADLLLFAKLMENLTDLARQNEMPDEPLFQLVQIDKLALDMIMSKQLYPVVDGTRLALLAIGDLGPIQNALAEPLHDFVRTLDLDNLPDIDSSTGAS